MKNEFISVVSHELRTPLASIRGSLGLRASGVLAQKPEASQQMLNIAANNTERLVRLVNDILDLERLESNKVTLNKQWCDAASLIHQSVETLQPLAEKNTSYYQLPAWKFPSGLTLIASFKPWSILSVTPSNFLLKKPRL